MAARSSGRAHFVFVAVNERDCGRSLQLLFASETHTLTQIGRRRSTVGYRGSYMSFLKATAVPWLVMGMVALAMLMFPNRLAFLVRY